MTFTLRRKNRTLIIYLTGELDLVKANEFRETVDNTMEEMMAKNLIIDLSSVNFIDSSGLGVILGRFRKISAKEGQVVLVGLNSNVRRILELSGILSFIPVCTDETDAWELFEKNVI
ncbi:MAG: anti-sigma F factor antagonist [Firmicutes bacterium HGW-Firmicutes-12]|jgi:stage II sporulation protein AA (anti-sigma F factor antagonist)|nr:MAG: anti-sigma F factor antagonist [Firmicutes bacterium HGW-Firmicutes-12]